MQITTAFTVIIMVLFAHTVTAAPPRKTFNIYSADPTSDSKDLNEDVKPIGVLYSRLAALHSVLTTHHVNIHQQEQINRYRAISRVL
jgi:hypothetical protein